MMLKWIVRPIFHSETEPNRAILAIILILAFILRLCPILWGIGVWQNEGFYHPDESKVWLSIQHFPENFLTNPNLLYGTIYQYTIAILLWPVSRFVDWSGLFNGLSQPQFLVIATRGMNCLLGTGAIIQIYLLGRRIRDQQMGFTAAALLCVSFYQCLNSSLATLDVAMSFFALAWIVNCWDAIRWSEWSKFLGLSIVGAYLIGGKISGVLFFIVPVALFVQQSRLLNPMHEAEDSPNRFQHVSRFEFILRMGIVIFLAVLLAAFAAPHISLNPIAFLRTMARQQYLWVGRVDHSMIAIFRVWWTSATTSCGYLVPVLMMGGVASSLCGRRCRIHPLETTSLIVLLLHVLFWQGYAPPRFLIVLTPIFCIFAARAIRDLQASPNASRRIISKFLFWGAMAEGILLCLMGVHDRFTDSRTRCSREISLWYPRGIRIAMLTRTEQDPQPHRWRYPALDRGQHILVSVTQQPDFILTSSYVTELLERSLRLPGLRPSYQWPDSERNFWPNYQPPTPAELKFADQLIHDESPYKLIATWKAPLLGRPEFGSPELNLYARQPEPQSD